MVHPQNGQSKDGLGQLPAAARMVTSRREAMIVRASSTELDYAKILRIVGTSNPGLAQIQFPFETA